MYTSYIINKVYTVIMVFILSTTARTQDILSTQFPDSTYYVDEIVVFGNTITKDFVILQEMSLKQGALLTRQLLEYDKQRIYSLGLFNEVQIVPQPKSENTVRLLVTVHERWYLYPFPIIGIKDRDWGKFYFGLGVAHLNFRGCNEKVYLAFALGYDPWFAVSYKNVLLSKDKTYFLSARIASNKIANKSLQAKTIAGNFSQRHSSLSTTVNKRFTIASMVWFSLGYEVVDISDVSPPMTLSSSGKDHFPIISLGASYDTRDLIEYPSYGTFLQGTITKFGLPTNDVNIIRYAIDIRKYIPLTSDFVLKSRMFTNLAGAGATPVYNRTYFGYDERIRGHFHKIFEGENIVGVSAELNYPLLSPLFFTINFLPEEFSVWKFGIYAALFADAGTVWFRGYPFALNLFTKGYGIGLHFILPYSTVLRAEYAFNENRKGEFIFDLGATF